MSVAPRNPLIAAFEAGVEPGELRQDIVEVLSPFFTDHVALKEKATLLAGEYINVLTIQEDHRLYLVLKDLITTLLQPTLSSYRTELLEAVSTHHPNITERLARYWNAFHRQVDLSTLTDEDFPYEAFQTLGVLIEGLAFPYISFYYDVVAIAKRERTFSQFPTLSSLQHLA